MMERFIIIIFLNVSRGRKFVENRMEIFIIFAKVTN